MIHQIPVCYKNSIAILAVVLAILDPIAVYAAPETMPDGTLFDAAYYAAAYPDVTAALGTDPNVLYNHYRIAGKAEGRQPVAPGAAAATSMTISNAAASAATAPAISARDRQVATAAAAMQAAYPEGTPWTTASKYVTTMRLNGRSLVCTGYGCYAFAVLFCDTMQGGHGSYTKIPACAVSQIRTGDIVRIPNALGGHTCVILALDGTGATIAEGAYNGYIHYGRHVTNAELATNEYVMTW